MKARRLGSCLATIAILGLALALALPALAADAPKDSKKQTPLGKYVTAAEAYDMWRANPDKVKVLDVRTWEEYAFIGHAPMAHNLPSKHLTGKWDSLSKSYGMADNQEFEAAVKKLFKSDDTILVMCRSGQRSAMAIARMAQVGFTNVFNIIDGFEGEAVSDADSYFKGKRMLNGWKNSPAPWTYALDSSLVFVPGD
jgi:rhodanese-related sulfurtransferase